MLALKDRLPPKSPEVEKAQPMRLVMELLEGMRNPPLVAQRKHPSFVSVRAAVLGFAGITIQELWSIRDARAFDLRAGVLRIPAKRVVERYTTVGGHGRLRVVVEQREARVVKLGSEAMEACRQYLAYPDRYPGRWQADQVRVFRRRVVSSGVACCDTKRRLGILSLSPYDFGTDRAPSMKEVRALVQAMRHTMVPYRPTR